jgi:hypothetical protein
MAFTETFQPFGNMKKQKEASTIQIFLILVDSSLSLSLQVAYPCGRAQMHRPPILEFVCPSSNRS